MSTQGAGPRRRVNWFQLISAAVVAIITVIAASLADGVMSSAARIFRDNPPPTIEQTSEHHVILFDPEGSLGSEYTVTEHIGPANCWEESLVSESPGALRCAANDYLFDPCWQKGSWDSGHVGCLLNPWSRKVTILNLPSGTGEYEEMPRNEVPWGLEIQNPNDRYETVRCSSVAGGTIEFVDGKPIYWKCFDKLNKHVGWAVGNIEESKSGPWKVFFSGKRSDQIVQTPIKNLWW
ncbi:hypothetical protein OG496_31675 [Streptomyces sp. NBC_00988]|uniref:hypothetical protein n=1 Tax=Streptomyces sp. NBC_00988 TaxID=2903704 RepID=UPI00386C07F3|nr:hypothetical protein OG496_31675 [Streptomyces sp. NBC_00988]